MKRCFFSIGLLSSLASCSASDLVDPPDRSGEIESLGEASQNLNGVISPSGFLVKKSLVEPDKDLREQDTANYYASVGSNSNGAGAKIKDGLGTLAQFQSQFGFGTYGITTSYYNRGDLGLGREMHCSDRMLSNQQSIACYVTNYASGPAGSEFTFGFSPQIAFDNMAAGNPVATVAMVYRKKATTNKVIFIAYDAAGNITNAAPLDRHGITGEGTPGGNFNNHIPSNCLNCHGGTYASGSFQVSGALFLPFDLDQFDYQVSPSRAAQESTFATMNQLVRTVAADVSVTQNPAHPVLTQIDKWYEPGDGVFHGENVPTGWEAEGDKGVFQSVVRKSCRGCHMTSPLSFDSAEAFRNLGGLIGQDIKNNVMPHALQTQRLFWQSGQPKILADYFSDNELHGVAADIAAGGPNNIVTLDPHLIQATF
jgi:hypothetical protein